MSRHINNQTRYAPPTIITYDGDKILEELGPAQTCAKAGGGCPADSVGLLSDINMSDVFRLPSIGGKIKFPGIR
jgi:hypothetical protein